MLFSLTRRLSVSLGQRARLRRYRRFVELCALETGDSIVDVGAGGGGALAVFNDVNPITAVDREPWPNPPDATNVTFVAADARRLPFPDRAFDVAFSNSVIEHMGPADQAAVAREIRRVADRYFVQTPNRWFPIEPHYQLPFFQFLPRRLKKALNARFTLGWQRRGQWEEITLLSAADLRRLFPDAEIHRERMLGLTKSLMAVRRRAATDPVPRRS